MYCSLFHRLALSLEDLICHVSTAIDRSAVIAEDVFTEVGCANRITVANLILEYVLANAAVARSFSGYFANLIGKDSSFFAVTPNDSLNLDFWAFGLVLAATALLCYSTRESSTFNLGAPKSLLHLLAERKQCLAIINPA